ncbi:mucin-15 [Notolabrus celidotus]|uniref:mucin-15 n=1 Tax=Notolabrus celidotus TaxID=1203425 RepID=UPI0014903062|nr:mucin-15 [Notolabrus celidotus]XP_034535448.1 mucin-15 [Notolabrus celidotus]XP_034535449.1 mucin-15 [Notolabrus celidotus]
MKLCLRLTVSLFLLVQAFNLASLQESTDSPGQPIDQSWLRQLAQMKAESQNTALSEGEKEYDHDAGRAAAESNNDYSGIASGSMAMYNEEEENVADKDKDANESDYMDVVTTTVPLNVTTKQPEFQNTTDTPVNATTDQTNSSIVNTTEAEEEFYNSTTIPQNSTTPPIVANTTSFPEFSNHTDFNTTTLAPEVNATQEPTTTPQNDIWFMNGTQEPTTTSQNDTWSMNATESTSTTTVTQTNTTTTSETTHTPTVFLSTTLSDSATTDFSPATSTVAPTNTSKGNETDKSSGSGSSSERGLASDTNSQRHSSWGAILGTAVAVVCVGLVAYVILKHKHQKDFSHRKLVEEFPSDPVHRLDNNEPLDLNFGGSAYYNPALQGDNIQMTNFP